MRVRNAPVSRGDKMGLLQIFRSYGPQQEMLLPGLLVSDLPSTRCAEVRRIETDRSHFPSESITVKSLPLRVSGVAGWSVVMNTMPGYMPSSIAACTSAGGLIRSTIDELGLVAPFLPVL